jgi:hypothetical protein
MASEELVPQPPLAPAGEPTTEIIPVVDPTPTTEVHVVPPAGGATTGTEIVPSTMRREFDPLRLISEQVMENGEAEGRPHLTGFWLRDRNGKVYEFTDYDAYAVTNKEVKQTRRRPRARSTIRGGPYWGRAEKEEIIMTPGTGQRWTVSVTGPDGQPADIIGYENGGLEAWLDHPTDEATPFEWFTAFGWHDAVERSRQNASREVRPIKLANPDKSVFDTVTEHQGRLGLGLKDVAWRVNGELQRITEDTLLMEGPEGHKHPVRTFVVKTYNAAGDAKNQRVYQDDGLKKHLNTMGKALSDLHMEMPEVQPEPPVISSLGRIGASFILAPSPGHEDWRVGPDTAGREYDTNDGWISEGQAIRLLAYEDIFTFDDIYRDKLSVADRVRVNGEQFLEKYAGLLQKTVGELGKNAVIDMASRVSDEYVAALRDYGLEQGPEDSSLGLMLWQMMEQRYLSKHPKELTDEFQRHDDFGVKIGDPFSNDPIEARRVQRMIVNDLIGRRIADTALVITKPGEKVLGHDKEGHDVVKEVPDTYGFDWNAFNALRLSAFVKQEIVDILQTVTSGSPGRKLSKRDFVAIGLRAQRARSVS